ncbi:elongation factor 4 [Candidatus Saccharibacteria bacterium]|nr:elongation factor 4 [Candidatus Saccharibacteria bacterium]NIV03238.1 elongation factor 4 [Calditrichia bacterium]NIS37751.1 elongation factor 4 [Candidatus Saccharibacteria bacterium]NIV71359.1 elongation factor 4 [Calditrichia bacterium]NIV97875.1 elongation factor 4 [Candidatus Saccharibacteria bacterium]
MENIRNFCIIAHIDHGKSTLADRMLELTGTVDKRKMKEQLLDTMELERERGITIKLQPVRMEYDGMVFNLIDTPGHVDFNYEVSRSLAAVEGAILLVDATQGVQAQTLGNLHMALDQNLTIIPVLNKIDLPNAEVDRRREELVKLLGCDPQDVLEVSAKTGENVGKVLKAVSEKVPGPKSSESESLQALIFDSNYDDYKGVVAYVRVVSGEIEPGKKIKLVGTSKVSEALEVGYFFPEMKKSKKLSSGEIGYVVTGFKTIQDCRVGDTITLEKGSAKALSGYKEVKPMVYAGVFPKDGADYPNLRDAMEKLKLNDASLTYEPERSQALGFGFRCGLLGMLHLEILQERLHREYDLDLVVTVPSVAYHLYLSNGEEMTIKSAQEMPDPSQIDHIDEPWVKLDIITPTDYVGNIMSLVSDRRGEYKNTEYLDKERAILHYDMPLSSVIVDFYDKLKSVSSGYASLNYELSEYRTAKIVKLDILVAEEPAEALAMLLPESEAYKEGRRVVKLLKESLPRKQFVIKLQAAIGGKIIAAERLSAFRKDVTAGLYGGDVTRKRKLLEKQKKGKKKMLSKGSVDIPTETYLKVLKR